MKRIDSEFYENLLNNSIELKPCLFCGSKAYFVTQFHKNALGYNKYSATYSVGIKCLGCTIAGIEPYQDTVWLEEVEKEYMKRGKIFAEIWNRRVGVEVVRCKDCKFYHTEECAIDDWHFSETKEDDFCSFAERKE